MFMQLTWFSVKVVAGRDKFVVVLCGEVDEVCEKVVRCRVHVVVGDGEVWCVVVWSQPSIVFPLA